MAIMPESTSCFTPSSKCSSSMSVLLQEPSARPVLSSMGQVASSNEYDFGLKSHLHRVAGRVYLQLQPG
eukprot:scaffold17595_cov61-Phaeocystis_antarctica.AAC.3